MDAYYDIVSLRTVREYADQPVADEALNRILQAGRASGSSQNRQQWQFYVARSREILGRIAETVYAPDNLKRCRLAIAIASTGKGGFDIGRCAQNMMLAARAVGVASAPNGVKDAEALGAILGLAGGQSVVTVLSLGHPVNPFRTTGDTEGILRRIDRKPLEELVVRVD